MALPSDSWILIPVHNRAALTLACIACLRRTGVMQWAQVLVVDDGSTDGTAAQLRATAPEVRVLHGDGSLWWGGAMRMGMKYACQQGAQYLIWLNDDCEPLGDALAQLRAGAAARGAIMVGVARTPTGYEYGGHVKNWRGLHLLAAPGPEPIACDTFGGNCVCIPRAVVDRIGLPDSRHFPHQWCDADYGLRARRAGIPIFVLPVARARNSDNFASEQCSWLLDASLLAVWKSFFSIKSIMHIPSRWHFYCRHWGLWGVVLFAYPYLKFAGIALLRALLPHRCLLRWRGGASSRHQRLAKVAAKPGEKSP